MDRITDAESQHGPCLTRALPGSQHGVDAGFTMSGEQSLSASSLARNGVGPNAGPSPARCWSICSVTPSGEAHSIGDVSIVWDESGGLRAARFASASEVLAGVAGGVQPRWLPVGVDLMVSEQPCPEGAQLERYFAGRCWAFDFAQPEDGSAFDREVWRAIAEIPLGCTTSYGALASYIGRPGAAQAVGAAVGRNPRPVFVACHRVLARGNALGGFSGGLARKSSLLRWERDLFRRRSGAEAERRRVIARSRLELSPLVLASDQMELL